MEQLIVTYGLAYYLIASLSLILRVFFQLYIYKERVTSSDFIASIFWIVLIWLIPLNYLRDINTVIKKYKEQKL